MDAGDRLAIESSDRQIFTVRPDGTNRIPLSTSDEATTSSLASWSPDSSRLAWVATEPRTGTSTLRSARADGSGWSDQPIPGRPVALAWAANSSRMAVVAEGSQALQLGVLGVDQTESYSIVDGDSPLFFSWSPDADALLVHAGAARLDLVPVDGSPPRALAPRPGRFQAPAWLPGAAAFVYAIETEDDDRLVVTASTGAGQRELVRYDGYLRYAASPASGLVAVHLADPSTAPDAATVTVAHRSARQPDDPVDVVDRGQLMVIAVFGGEPILLHPLESGQFDQPVRAFYWSRDGTSLAWLVEEEGEGGDCASTTRVVRWRFWSDGGVFDGPAFFPSATFACTYLPVFDQHAQTNSYWSPDGSQIVYAGIDALTGERGVFVLEVRAGASPTRVTEGVHAVWSPAAAASAASAL